MRKGKAAACDIPHSLGCGHCPLNGGGGEVEDLNLDTNTELGEPVLTPRKIIRDQSLMFYNHH